MCYCSWMEASEPPILEPMEDSKPYPIFVWRYNRRDLEVQELPAVDLSNPVKKDYTDMASALIGLSTFAGGLTIATQFIAQCSGSRVEALLAMASQLFLGTPLCLMTIYLHLYGIKDKTKIDFRSSLHALIVGQFSVSGLLLSTAFILLGVAIFAAEVDGKRIGILGLLLLSVFLIVAIVAGFHKSGLWKFRPGGPNEVIWPSVWRTAMWMIPQVVAFGLLLGFGSHAASKAPFQNGCPSVTTSGTSSAR